MGAADLTACLALLHTGGRTALLDAQAWLKAHNSDAVVDALELVDHELQRRHAEGISSGGKPAARQIAGQL